MTDQTAASDAKATAFTAQDHSEWSQMDSTETGCLKSYNDLFYKDWMTFFFSTLYQKADPSVIQKMLANS